MLPNSLLFFVRNMHGVRFKARGNEASAYDLRLSLQLVKWLYSIILQVYVSWSCTVYFCIQTTSNVSRETAKIL